MAKAIFYHKDDSTYKDIRGRQYHFPKMYLSRVQQALGDWIVYYGPLPGSSGRYYSGLARVTAVEPDDDLPEHYYARLADYIDFDSPLDYRLNGGFERQLVAPDGSVNPGRSVQAVRVISDQEFVALVQEGLSEPDEWPQRTDQPDGNSLPHHPLAILAVEENAQADYSVDGFIRPIIAQTINRPFRDAKFRQHIRRVYDRTCAFTGLRLINGGGRPEVEAAHIVPVERGGNDSVQNGIALSGTVHWMFDRGLLSLADDFSILQSRQLNEDVSHLLVRDGRARVPSPAHLRPHPHYLAWHRDNIFKH
ncbi:HNH endonuclease [Rhizobium sp. AG855]|uniref:HNH endonuclease n=1 Tax=Rhizobium sp. AG855 TaxID=2183898 RepID=UPI000E76BDFB|nr:HNH endonuclease [Rhizobium sp. AG855]RKE84669.1 putative restriction endonuclease [Rhizobium sp. AG855]